MGEVESRSDPGSGEHKTEKIEKVGQTELNWFGSSVNFRFWFY